MTETTPTPQPPAPGPAPATPPPAVPPAAPATCCPIAPFLPHAVLGGAALLFVAFFLPWWSLSIKTPMPPKLPDNPTAEDQKDFQKAAEAYSAEMKKLDGKDKDMGEAMSENQDWYTDHVSRSARTDMEKSGRRTGKGSASIMGWSAGTGVTGFVLSFFMAGLVLAPRFVRPIQPFAWMGGLANAIMGLLIFLLTLIGWLICSPGKDVSPIMAQGISIGVWFALIGSAAIVAGGAMCGLMGLMAVLGRAKR